MRRGWQLRVALAASVTIFATACGSDGGDGAADPTQSAASAPKPTSDQPTSGQPSAIFPPSSTMERISLGGKVTIGVSFDAPGFGEKDTASGKVIGFDVEIAKIVAAALGIKDDGIEFVEVKPQTRDKVLKAATVDLVVASYPVTEDNSEVVSFAGPYFLAGHDMLVKKGNPKAITAVADLKALRVCLVDGSAAQASVRQHASRAEVTFQKSLDKCVEQLSAGKVDAVVALNTSLAPYAARTPAALQLLGRTFTKDYFGVAVAKDDSEFVEFINGALEKANADGRWSNAYAGTAGKLLKTAAKHRPSGAQKERRTPRRPVRRPRQRSRPKSRTTNRQVSGANS